MTEEEKLGECRQVLYEIIFRSRRVTDLDTLLEDLDNLGIEETLADTEPEVTDDGTERHCAANDCKRAVAFVSPKDLCDYHWHEWFLWPDDRPEPEWMP